MSKDLTSAVAHPGVARVGKYLMLDLLGEGAFGKVRLAVDEHTGKEYAMKIMEKSHIKANELTLQVRREIAVMKAMRHPNIVNLHEVLTSSKNLYMVMDLVTGGELFDAVAEKGRLPESTTRSYFQQLIDGVHYCHSRRVYHRDLKPENLLLSGDKQTLKITDFGLSSIKAQNASSELLHTIMGSPHYIAPEIITSASQGYEGGKVDVWAAGVILFGMLAGCLPFDEPNTRALYQAIVHNPVQYPPHFSYDVIKLLRALLQKNPNRRPSMEQVKNFTWFKVDYEPAVIPQPKEHSSGPVSSKKSKHRTKKPAQREVPQTATARRRGSGHAPPSSTFSLEDKRHPFDISSGEPAPQNTTLTSCSVIGGQGESSNAMRHMKTAEGVNLNQLGAPRDAWDRENVDPYRYSDSNDENRLASGDRGGPNVAHNGQPPLRAVTHSGSNNTSHGQASEVLASDERRRRDSNEIETRAAEVSGHRQLSAQPRRRTSTANQMFPGGHASRQDKVPLPQYPQAQPKETTYVTRGVEMELLDVSAEQLSPSPAASQLSSMNSESSSTRIPPTRRESLRLTRNLLCSKQSTLSDFVSPVSLSARSPQVDSREQHEIGPFMPDNYRSMMKPLFGVVEPARNIEDSGDAAQNSVTPLKRSGSEAKAGSTSCTNGYDNQHSAVNTESIFRPMKSAFLQLAGREAERESKPSTSPSVYCPEFDSDGDGSPQWCIDSMEVFADFDVASGSCNFEGSSCDSNSVSALTSERLMELMKAGELAASVSSGTPKPIFGATKGDLVVELSQAPVNKAHKSGVSREAQLTQPDA